MDLKVKKEFYTQDENRYIVSNNKFEVMYVCSEDEYDFYYAKALEFINTKK